MKKAISRHISVAFLFSAAALGGPFEDCILQNMKGVTAQTAAGAVYRACQEKTTPKQCRDGVLRQIVEKERKDFPCSHGYHSFVAPPSPKPKKGGADWSDLVTDLLLPMCPQTDEQLLADHKKKCHALCETASWWERKFGACATD